MSRAPYDPMDLKALRCFEAICTLLEVAKKIERTEVCGVQVEIVAALAQALDGARHRFLGLVVASTGPLDSVAEESADDPMRTFEGHRVGGAGPNVWKLEG